MNDRPQARSPALAGGFKKKPRAAAGEDVTAAKPLATIAAAAGHVYQEGFNAVADAVKSGDGWRLSPADYMAARPAPFRAGVPSSCYVAMRDGCRLAVDVYLPEAGPEAPDGLEKRPTIL